VVFDEGLGGRGADEAAGVGFAAGGALEDSRDDDRLACEGHVAAEAFVAGSEGVAVVLDRQRFDPADGPFAAEGEGGVVGPGAEVAKGLAQGLDEGVGSDDIVGDEASGGEGAGAGAHLVALRPVASQTHAESLTRDLDAQEVGCVPAAHGGPSGRFFHCGQGQWRCGTTLWVFGSSR